MLSRRGVRRLPGGRLRVMITGNERQALQALPGQLLPIVTGEDAADDAQRIRARLFPPASADPDTERTYRQLVGEGLVQERVDLLARFAASLDRGSARGGNWAVELDPDEAHAWLTVVNDTRLTLSTVLGITTESDWELGPNPRETRSVLLWWLGWLEEQLVGGLMHGLDE